jgi:transcriptional regulator with XRE-family HTH domain
MSTSLSQFVIERRGKKSQREIAKSVGVDASLLSLVEGGRKKIRVESLKKLAKGLDLTREDWELMKLLWLQEQTGEPILTPTMMKARDRLALNDREADAEEEFYTSIRTALRKNMALIKSEKLSDTLVSVLQNARMLRALRNFYEVYHTLNVRG